MGIGRSSSDFATLLRQLRTSAGLTQEELAESAALSPRTISDLERGVSLTARAPTARLLASALNLTGLPAPSSSRQRTVRKFLPLAMRASQFLARNLLRV